jgi:hypothetical protein
LYNANDLGLLNYVSKFNQASLSTRCAYQDLRSTWEPGRAALIAIKESSHDLILDACLRARVPDPGSPAHASPHLDYQCTEPSARISTEPGLHREVCGSATLPHGESRGTRMERLTFPTSSDSFTQSFPSIVLNLMTMLRGLECCVGSEAFWKSFVRNVPIP